MKIPVLLLPALLPLAALYAEESAPVIQPHRAAEMFQTAKVWPVHFSLTADQFAAMEPKRNPQQPNPFAPPPGGFGPGMILTAAIMHDADRDGDHRCTAAELDQLAEKWAAAWDVDGKGKATSEEVKTGLNLVFANMGPAPGGGGGGGGLNLQGQDGQRNGLASAMGITTEYVTAGLDFAGVQFDDVAVRFKGNGTLMQSLMSPKRSLKVDLKRHVDGQKVANVSVLNLHNCVTDGSWMNEVLSYGVFRDAGVPAPRTAFAAVSVTVTGKYDHEYLGLYSLVENPDAAFAEEYFGKKKGAIFKPVTPQPFTDLGDDWAQYAQTYDPKTDIDKKQKARVIDFCKLVSHADDAEFNARLGDYLDLDEFAGFMAGTVWLATLDSILGPGQNYYVYLHPKTQKFQFIPWDLDHSFGQFPLMGTAQEREQLSIEKPWRGETRLLMRVFAHPEFQRLYRAALGKINNVVCAPERIQKQVDDLAVAIRPWIEKESADKVSRFDRLVKGEALPPVGFGAPPGGGAPPAAPGGGASPGPGGGPNGPPESPFGFLTPSKPIKGFVVARRQSVADQLSGNVKSPEMGFGFGGPPGRPGAFGPGNFLRRPLVAALDTDKDDALTRDELAKGFATWYRDAGGEPSGSISEEQLRAALNKVFPQPQGPQGPGGPGGPGGPTPQPPAAPPAL